jgi:tyrosine-protein phosphatase YwqE
MLFKFFSKRNSNALDEIDFSFLSLDMHNHLLPGIDDGSPNVAATISMVEAMEALGFTHSISTPHIYPTVHNNNAVTIEAAFKQVSNNRFFLKPAAEYMLNTDFIALPKEQQLLTINDKYVLVEMSYVAETSNLQQYIYELCMAGYKPILAHPERYLYYNKQVDKISEIVSWGCLLQANLLSFSGYYGSPVKEFADILLSNNLYAFAGTDVHHQRHINKLIEMKGNTTLMQQLAAYGFQNKSLLHMVTTAI